MCCNKNKQCGGCNPCNKCKTQPEYCGEDLICLDIRDGDTYGEVLRKINSVVCKDPEDYTFEENPICENGGIIVRNKAQEVVFSQCYPVSGDCCSDIDILYEDLVPLKNNGSLEKGRTYHITDRDIWLRASDISQFSTEATRRFSIVKDEHYTPNGDFLGIYGQTLDKGSVPVSDITNTYRAIWGGKVWKRDTTGLDVAGTDYKTIQSGWTVVPTTDLDYYEPKMFSIDYNFDDDIIWTQRDDRGNVVKKYNSFLDFIDETDWGNESIYNNNSGGILNNHILTFGKARIYHNNIQAYIANNASTGEMHQNTALAIYDNVERGKIHSNNIDGEISNNLECNVDSNYNKGSIMGNKNMFIKNNSCIGTISGNTVDNVNTSTASIINNSNNGGIMNNIMNHSVKINNNTNNGDIGTVTATIRVSDITDPIVNK